MRLVLNEVTEAEKIIEDGTLGNKPFEDMVLLARYWRQIKELSPKETKKKLHEIAKSNISNYSADNWGDAIDKIVANAKKYPLLQLDKIVITQTEMTHINALNKKNQQRLAFTLLVLAKYGNARSTSNNNWVLLQKYKVFQLARVTSNSKWNTLRELNELGLIKFANKVDNINVQVTFVDNGEPELCVTDLRELGYQYLRYTGEDFIECQNCGILVRKTVHNKRYCKNCVGYQPIKTKKVTCCDCGEEFEVDSMTRKTVRCDFCQREKDRENNRKRINKLRNIGNCNANN